ncbi:hypothetical protein [Halocynthiibacter namhaensis]|uniref:hypothetical protein n=1 Tax=Halocynthiibacter namhaensis TaxID=1290553 RepID=UPI00068F302A|nr:hypothetical protein [Halocynthiibacter namhaensis]
MADLVPDLTKIDPKGLFTDVYSMDGITLEECRSVFLDWAISGKDDVDETQALADLHAHFATPSPDHPMSSVLRDAVMGAQNKGRRRGGARGRPRPDYET